MRCYRCGESLTHLSLPLLRMEECPSCTVPLHVCRMCMFFDPHVPRQCTEEDADEVKVQDKARANFCDYFKPSDSAFDGSFSATEAKAKDELTALFGGDAGETENDDSVSDADKLFK